MKKILSVILFTILLSISSFAAGWQSDSNGWWYQNDDGTYPTNGWQWIDGNNDGIAESYYFDNNGYCLTNQQTPDGYYVNENGAWIVNGKVQIIIIIDKSLKTSYPVDLGIDLGMSLNDAVRIFKENNVEYYTDSYSPNSLYYYDCEGFFNSYGFNSNGICTYMTRIFYTSDKAIADATVDKLSKQVNIPLISHSNNERLLKYFFASEQDNSTVIIQREWDDYLDMYQVAIQVGK